MHAGCRRIDKAYQAFSRSVLIAIAVMSSLAAAAAQQGSPGLTQRTIFPAFDPPGAVLRCASGSNQSARLRAGE